jgi:hypothetical protein
MQAPASRRQPSSHTVPTAAATPLQRRKSPWPQNHTAKLWFEEVQSGVSVAATFVPQQERDPHESEDIGSGFHLSGTVAILNGRALDRK